SALHVAVLVLDLDVVVGRITQAFDVFLAELAHQPSRVAGPQLATAHHLAGADHGTGGDGGIGFDHRAIEDAGAHADEAVITNRAGVDDAAVANRDAFADQGWVAALVVGAVVADVNDRAVLHIGACADADVIHVATDHRARPDRSVIRSEEHTSELQSRE